MEQVIRVFLADASRSFLELLRASLEQQPDLSVMGASSSGDDAYARLMEQHPDVLVTDLLLPGLDGLSLLRRLRNDERLPRTVVVSAFTNVEIAQAVGLLGVRDYLLKPCDMKELVFRIREAADVRPALIHGYDQAIREALMKIGIPSHLNGRAYLEEALRRTLSDHSLIHGVTKILYPDLAQHFATTSKCIEHSIRTAIEKGWARGTQESRYAVFGDFFGRFESDPGNAKFLSAMTAYIEWETEQRDVWKRQ